MLLLLPACVTFTQIIQTVLALTTIAKPIQRIHIVAALQVIAPPPRQPILDVPGLQVIVPRTQRQIFVLAGFRFVKLPPAI
jgi:hypothetical protein